MQKRQNKHPDPTPWLFLAPSLCGVTLFVLAPFVETVRRSVTWLLYTTEAADEQPR